MLHNRNIYKLIINGAFGLIIIHVITFIITLSLFLFAFNLEMKNVSDELEVILLIVSILSVIISLSVVIYILNYYVRLFVSEKQYYVSWVIALFYCVLSYVEYKYLQYVPKYWSDYYSFPSELFSTPNAIIHIIFIDGFGVDSGLLYVITSTIIYVLHVIVPIAVVSLAYFRTRRDRENV